MDLLVGWLVGLATIPLVRWLWDRIATLVGNWADPPRKHTDNPR